MNAHICAPTNLDYAWNELASPIVDVGGGIGSLEMALLKSGDNSHLKFIIFDIPQTINDGQNVTTYYIDPLLVVLNFTLDMGQSALAEYITGFLRSRKLSCIFSRRVKYPNWKAYIRYQARPA